mmetsp:Transcript_1991/g.4462  ORF Transcript_1991/g.4462 Transcript_1991/m.4462 type:complete len:96 (-) Transcript_1991:188-475(-)
MGLSGCLKGGLSCPTSIELWLKSVILLYSNELSEVMKEAWEADKFTFRLGRFIFLTTTCSIYSSKANHWSLVLSTAQGSLTSILLDSLPSSGLRN